MTQQKMTCCSEPAHPAGQKRKASVKQTEKDTAQVPGPKVSFVHGEFRWEPPVLTFQLATARVDLSAGRTGQAWLGEAGTPLRC